VPNSTPRCLPLPSADHLHSRSPFRCASSTSIIGSVSHPVETGLLPSVKRGYRNVGNPLCEDQKPVSVKKNLSGPIASIPSKVGPHQATRGESVLLQAHGSVRAWTEQIASGHRNRECHSYTVSRVSRSSSFQYAVSSDLVLRATTAWSLPGSCHDATEWPVVWVSRAATLVTSSRVPLNVFPSLITHPYRVSGPELSRGLIFDLGVRHSAPERSV
jgi:hypothetical protein